MAERAPYKGVTWGSIPLTTTKKFFKGEKMPVKIKKYNNDQETKDMVFNRIIEWCKHYDLYHSESIMQNDNGLIKAPVLLSDIVDDIIQFEVDWEDD